MNYAVGSIVKSRGREWVVLPDSSDELLLLRPLGGTEDEITGIHLGLEEISSASFELPGPQNIGDYKSCRLLRDAIKLSSRSSAGPFRSFSRIAVEPRPYQLVPLLMALKQNPIRILIADDVGIGKTIEACLIARELLDRGEVSRMAVLCPPHLAEQWQKELKEKFHIEAELVLSSTARKLERNCRVGQSLFDIYPFVIVSLDFIKSDRRRNEFLRTCPELIIVDEAHSCAYPVVGKGYKHQRHQLLKALSQDLNKHIILVTATPHSGKENAFRSLLAFLNKEFENLPDNLISEWNEPYRRKLAEYFVQRRRADIKNYLNVDTFFPDREEAEETYELSPEYKQFFDRVIKYAQEIVLDEKENRHKQRIRWWSAIALLRSVASSPEAAAATLKNRTPTADAETIEETDEIGKRVVFDMEEDDEGERTDFTPGSDIEELSYDQKKNREILLDMARAADKLKGEKDEKLNRAIILIKKMVKDGYNPIIFCRFIPTAKYVAEEIRKKLPSNIEVAAVTGLMSPTEREQRVDELSEHSRRVLVCTDCLSEGINLQEKFDAVFHYDLSWNPTRHEQRAGRVDRFGQKKKKVRVLTYYGVDNKIDGIVLDVLIRKHKHIQSSLGISVPVPIDAAQVAEAIFEGLLLRGDRASADQLMMFEEFFKPKKEELHTQWENAADKEKKSRTMFAQQTIKVEEVAEELDQIRKSLGTYQDVREFVKEALLSHKASVGDNNVLDIDLSESPVAVREAMGYLKKIKAGFQKPVPDGVHYLNRTHPMVEGLANYIIDTALDPISESTIRRAGVIKTSQVDTRTTLLLVRFRYQLITGLQEKENRNLIEDCRLLSFKGSPANAEWWDDEFSENLIFLKPTGNILPEQSSNFVSKIIDNFDYLNDYLANFAKENGKRILESHQKVRRAAKMKNIRYSIETKLPPDILGIYVYLPEQSD